jgi:hypothetical protein
LGLQLDPPLTSEIAEVKEASHPVRYEAIDICLEQDACIREEIHHSPKLAPLFYQFFVRKKGIVCRVQMVSFLFVLQ